MKQKPLPKPSITEVFESYGARVIGSDNGGWQKATCALNDHEDNSPSASVNESECKWRCFSCDKSGDALDLIQENNGIGLAAAVEVAEGFAGGSNQPVRTERQQSGLLPGGSRHQPRGSHFVPSWKSL